MIKNIVLDMGNVCCKWDVSYIASQLASSLEEKDYIIKHLFQTKQWAQLDQGVLSLQDAKKQLIEQIPDKKRDLIVYAFVKKAGLPAKFGGRVGVRVGDELKGIKG